MINILIKIFKVILILNQNMMHFYLKKLLFFILNIHQKLVY